MGTKDINRVWFALFSICLVWVISISIAYGIYLLTHNIDSTGVIPPPTTSLPQTISPAPGGALLFQSYCMRCHRSSTINTKLTKAQLQSFLHSHNTGRTLTQEQIASIASFLNP